MKIQGFYLESITKIAAKLAFSIGATTSLTIMLPNIAQAITINFTGLVRSFEFNNGITQDGSIDINTPVTGEYTIDCLPSSCGSSNGLFLDDFPDSGATVEIGSYKFQTVPYAFGGAPGAEYNMFFVNLDDWLTLGIEESNGLLDMNRQPPGSIARSAFSSIAMQPSNSNPSSNILRINSAEYLPSEGPDVFIIVETGPNVKPIPEPNTIVGLFTVLVLGILSKRGLFKKKDSKQI